MNSLIKAGAFTVAVPTTSTAAQRDYVWNWLNDEVLSESTPATMDVVVEQHGKHGDIRLSWIGDDGDRRQMIISPDAAGDFTASLYEGASPPPNMLLRTWIDIPAEAWQRISPLRWQAPHASVPDVVLLAVVDHPELPTHAIGQYRPAGDPADIRKWYADLRQQLMQLIGQREACKDGTPVTRVDDWGLRVCVYCGAPDGDQHIGGRADGR